MTQAQITHADYRTMPQLALSLPHDPRLGARDFMPDASNRAALSTVGGWPDWTHPVLILSGPHAAGKTHLLHIWAARCDARLIAGKSGFDLATASWPRAVGIDDADRLEDQETLFHLFNHIVNIDGHLLLTAQRPPHFWPFTLPDLISRLKAAPHAAIDPPSDQLLAALLIKQLADRQMRIEAHIIDYLIKRVSRTAIDIAVVADRLDQLTLQRQRPISLRIAREALEIARGALDDPAA